MLHYDENWWVWLNKVFAGKKGIRFPKFWDHLDVMYHDIVIEFASYGKSICYGAEGHQGFCYEIMNWLCG